MAKLEILTLGPLQILSNHAPATGFLSDKVRALLIYLAAEQARPIWRETLAELLWPGQSHHKSRANLRRALANLRRVIDDENGRFLNITRQTLQFNAQTAAKIDFIQFDQLVNLSEPTPANMEAAVGLVNGRFLEGFSIDDSIAFGEWALLKREQVQRQLLHTLHLLTTHFENQHQPETAVRYAWQLVQTEPWYEPGQRQLLHLLSQTGQRAAAIGHYNQFQADLQAELSVQPEPATRRLYEQIRGAARQPIQTSTPPFLTQPAAPPPPFVAREQELAKLHSYLKTAVSHKAQFSFITGEAGSGKSSLLNTFAWQAQRQQPTLIPLFCSSPAHVGAGNPYQPIRAMLSHALGNMEPIWRDGRLSQLQASRLWSLRKVVLELLQNFSPECLTTLVDSSILPEAIQKTTTPQALPQEALFEQMARFLQKLSHHGPLLILLEDLHWADSGTIDLLFHLRNHLAGYPILFLGTYRPETLNSGPSQHPMVHLVHELSHDFGTIEVELNGADGRKFIDAWLDREPNQLNTSFRNTLHAKTNGHALFTLELVKSLKAKGFLYRDENGLWQASNAISWEYLPPKTEGILAERIDQLPANLRQLLRTATVQGETFSAEIVAQVAQRPYPDTLRALSATLGRHYKLIQPLGRQLIEGQTVSRYRFEHHLFQQYIYNRLDPNERAHLHQLTGETMVGLFETAVSRPSPLASQVAYHFEQALLPHQAINYYQLAGQHALNLSSHADAIAHYRQGLAMLANQPETAEIQRQELDSQLALGAALLAANGYTNEQVKSTYDRAFELCNRLDAAPEMVTTLFWLTSYYVVSGDIAKAITISEQMLAVIEQYPVNDMQRMQAHLLSGIPHFFMGQNQTALTHFQQASAIYDPPKHQPHVYTFGQDPGIAAMMWQGHVLFHQGSFAKASHCVQQALDWAIALDHPYTLTFIELLAGYSPNGYYLRDAQKARKHAQNTVSLAEKHQFPYLLALGKFYLGFETAVSQPQPNDGFSLMKEGLNLETAVGAKLGISARYLILADAHLQQNQITEAWQAITLARAEVSQRQELYLAPEIERVAGELQWLAGNTKQAEMCLQKAIQLARLQGATAWELKSATALCRLWQEQGKSAEAQTMLYPLFTKFEQELISPDVIVAQTLLGSLKEQTQLQ